MPRGRAKNTLESIKKRCTSQENGCVKYSGAHDPRGYARCSWDGVNTKVCTLLFEHEFGRVPENLELDHVCENKWCVNPYHLEIVTHKDNSRRHYHLEDGFCIHGHALEGDNAYKDPNGTRVRCRQCMSIDELRRVPRVH